MNRVYTVAFKRILASLSAQQITPANVQTMLQSNKMKPVGSYIFHRLARDEVRNFIKTPCPVENTTTEQNKSIIKSSKAIRASFSVQEKHVCSKCPHKQNCTEFSKLGIENTVNSMTDLLVFMQGMNNKSVLDVDKSQHRVWMSGYKACDSILATIEDLKRQSPQAIQFEKIRLEYMAEKQIELQNSEPKSQVSNKKEKKIKTQKTQKYEQIKTNDMPKLKGKKQNKIKKIDFNQDEDEDEELIEETQFQQDSFNKKVKTERRQNDKSHRLSKSTIPPDNFDVRKKQEYFEKPQFEKTNKYNDDFVKGKRSNSEPVYNGYKNQQPPRKNKYNDNYGSYNNKSAPKNNYRKDEYQRDDKYRQKQPRPAQREDRNSYQKDYKQYQRPNPRDRENRPQPYQKEKQVYQERNNNRKQNQKRHEKNMDFEQKFQKSANTYKSDKVFESWGQSEGSLLNKKGNFQRVVQLKQSSKQVEAEKISQAPKATGGRRVRR